MNQDLNDKFLRMAASCAHEAGDWAFTTDDLSRLLASVYDAGRESMLEAGNDEWLDQAYARGQRDMWEAAAGVCETGWKLGIGDQYQGDVFATAIRAILIEG